LTQQKVATRLTHHSGKVQSIEWNRAEPSVLLSGAYDKKIAITDIRQPSSTLFHKVDADVESVKWNPLEPQLLVVTTESGMLTYHDVRKLQDKAIFQLRAHDQATTAVSFSCQLPLMATSSLDHVVKIWDMRNTSPSLVAKRDMKVGPLYCMAFSPDSGTTLVAAGGSDQLAVWDTSENAIVQHQFLSPIKK